MNSPPKCQLCGTELTYRVIKTTNAAGIALGILCLVIGLALCATCVWAVLGIPLCVAAFYMMRAKREKVLLCPRCGAKTPAYW